MLDAFHRLMRGEAPQPTEGGDTVLAVMDDFIVWAKENKAPLTAKRYLEFCQGFVRAEVDGVRFGYLPVTKLTSRHVTAWINSEENWGPTTKRNAITALQAALNWAVLNRGLDRNPIRGMKTLSPVRKQKGTGVEVPKLRWELRKEARQKLIARQVRKYGKRFNHYAFRRTFIARKIIAGVDSHVVAKLSSHQSTAMIDKHYSAIADDAEFMLRMSQRDIEPK